MCHMHMSYARHVPHARHAQGGMHIHTSRCTPCIAHLKPPHAHLVRCPRPGPLDLQALRGSPSTYDGPMATGTVLGMALPLGATPGGSASRGFSRTPSGHPLARGGGMAPFIREPSDRQHAMDDMPT